MPPSMGLERRFFGIVAALVLFCLAAPPARAQWESISRVDAASCLIESSTGGYSVSYTAGEPAASLFKLDALDASSSSVMSGYLSQIPSNRLFLNIVSYESTGAVVSESALLGAETGQPVKFIFSNEVSTEAVASGLEVSEVLDHLAEPVGSTQTVSLALIPAESAVSLNSAPGAWKKGSIYAVRYSSGVDSNTALEM